MDGVVRALRTFLWRGLLNVFEDARIFEVIREANRRPNGFPVPASGLERQMSCCTNGGEVERGVARLNNRDVRDNAILVDGEIKRDVGHPSGSTKLGRVLCWRVCDEDGRDELLTVRGYSRKEHGRYGERDKGACSERYRTCHRKLVPT